MIWGLDKIEEVIRKTEEFLDTIDVKKYLQEDKDLYDVMDEIEEDYGKTLEDNPVFEGYVFNWMSSDEFGDYITKRYGIRIREEVITTYRIGTVD